MLQQDPYFLFSRPMTYFGNFQNLENEYETNEESSTWSDAVPFMTGINVAHPVIQPTGVYLYLSGF